MTHPLRPGGRTLGETGEPRKRISDPPPVRGRKAGKGRAGRPEPPGLAGRLGLVLLTALLAAPFPMAAQALDPIAAPDNAAAPQGPAAPDNAAVPQAPAAGDNAAASLPQAPADNVVSAPPAGAGTPEAPLPGAPTARIQEIKVSRTPHYTSIEAVVDGKIGNYNSFKLNDPFRIVVDIWGVAQGEAASLIPVDTPQVKAVKIAPQDGKLRVLVETPDDRPFPYLVNAEADRIVLSVGGGTEEKVTSLTRTAEGKPLPEGKAVAGIDIEDLPETANLVVTTTGETPYKVAKADGKKGILVLFFAGASAEKGLQRVIDAATLGLPVKKVTPAVSKKGVEVTVRYAPGTSYRIDTRGNAVVVAFAKTSAGEKSTLVASWKEKRIAAPAAGAGAGAGAAAGAAAAPGTEEPKAAAAAQAPPTTGGTPVWGFVTHEGGGGRKYIGQKISLDFKDADISNVFRIVAEVSGLNVITTDDVKGKVTLRLVNVPWDQALDIVLQAKGLGAKLDGNILRIAPLSTLRTEEKARLDAIKEVEKLQASLEGVVETIPVSYSKASDLQGKIKDLLSEGGKVQIDDRTNTIIVRDLKRNVENIKSLIATLDSATPQVLIEARIVEVDTNFTREIGVQWGGIKQGTAGATSWGVSGMQNAGGTFLSGLPISNTPNPFETANYAVNLPAPVGVGSGGGVSFGLFRNNLRLDMTLTAMEASGKGKVVSSPKVVTIDNKEALIEQGTQIPYSTVSASGTQTQFVDATLSLKVTPHITPEGSVIMRIEAKNDSPGDVGASGQPAINKKKATTEVLIRDGETAVIGGILQVTRKESQAAVPWLSKIPIVGFFFKKDRTESNNRELLIFITPKIVKQEPLLARPS